MTSPDFRAGLLRSAEMADEAKKLIHGNSRETFVQRAACDYIAKTIHAEAAAIKDEPQRGAPQYTLAQKAAAFEWLRSLALDEANPKALHAGVMLCEVAKLDQLRERNAI